MRPVDAARAGLGVLALAAPDRLATTLGSADTSSLRGVARVLGARYVGQGLLGAAVSDRRVWRADAAVDALHALSMVAAAWRWPRYRRAALASALVATTFAALDLHDSERDGS